MLYGYPIWGFPPSNCSIMLKYDLLGIKHLKTQIYELLESINVKVIDLVSHRYDKSRADVNILVRNVMDKVIILRNYRNYPTTFILAENVRLNTYFITETFYNKYCKFSLAVSKYSSNMLTLGELGKYPILIKQALPGILYW